MRPFNLDEYLKDPSRKLVTRDGNDARIICIDRIAGIYPVVALWIEKDFNGNPYEEIDSYTIDGKFTAGFENERDLFFANDPFPTSSLMTESDKGSKRLPWKANLFSNIKELAYTIIEVFLQRDDLLSNIIAFDENKVGKVE